MKEKIRLVIKGKYRLGELDKLMYELGLIVAGIAVILTLVYLITGISVLRLGFHCRFNQLTGLPCPGCGGTRSLRTLLGGRILKSLYYYPPLLYGVIIYIAFMLRCFAYRHFGIFNARDGIIVNYIYIGIALIIIQWIVKLAAQLIWGYYWFR